jgi:acyl-CoA thioesterase FadM
VIYEYQVAFSDVDFARVLFFGRYYDVVNRAAEHWMHQYGLFVRDLYGKFDLRIPIVASFCRYLGPIQLEDVIQVRCGWKDLNDKGVTLVFTMTRTTDERPSAWGYVERRFVSGEGRPRGAPPEITAVLERMADESRRFVEELWTPLAERYQAPLGGG